MADPVVVAAGDKEGGAHKPVAPSRGIHALLPWFFVLLAGLQEGAELYVITLKVCRLMFWIRF